jgi:NAD(P)-dependent dehydrogenase (short-subunit alcohol dehydrogenase family)
MKLALVTGGAKGIGRSIASRFTSSRVMSCLAQVLDSFLVHRIAGWHFAGKVQGDCS